MGTYGGLGTDQGDVDQCFRLEEGVECGKDVTLVVVPAQRIMGLGHLVFDVAWCVLNDCRVKREALPPLRLNFEFLK